MKKFLFIATIVALVMGTAVDASAKVKKGKRKATTTQTTTKQVKSNKNNMVIDQGMWTAEGAQRLENGDVANLEQAFLIGFYTEYVYTGNIYNDSYFRYLKLKFTNNGLESIKKDDGTYNWELITGNGNINAENFTIKEVEPKLFLVEGGGHKCYIKVAGAEGAYKIDEVKP
jgi:uncharacterized membrane protein YvbJ